MEAPRTPKTGAGERSSGPGPEGPRVEPVKPEGRRSSLGGGEDPERRERYESLMEQVVSADNYGAALGAVLRNRGAPGMDGMKTTEHSSSNCCCRSWGGSSNRGSASTATGSDRDAALTMP